MRLSSKVAVGLLAVAFLVAFTWVAGFLYWHVKLQGAVTSLEHGTAIQPDFEKGGYFGDYITPRRDREILLNAGCRALPYLVASLNDPQSPQYLAAASDLIILAASAPLSRTCDNSAWEKRIDRHMRLFSIGVYDKPDRRETKRRQILEWWREHGKGIHQGWRIWSRACPAQ